MLNPSTSFETGAPIFNQSETSGHKFGIAADSMLG